MKTNVYAIYDTKAAFYNKPFYQVNDQVLERTICDLLKDQQTDIARNAEDFIVFYLGTYDDHTAEFDLLPSPEVRFRCHELQARLWNLQADEASTVEQVEE